MCLTQKMKPQIHSESRERIDLPITGMTCAAFARIEIVLEKILSLKNLREVF